MLSCARDGDKGSRVEGKTWPAIETERRRLRLNTPTFCILFGEWIFASIPGTVFWPYFAGISILAIGIFRDGKGVLQAHGTDKILTLGPLFFALPMAVFASQHFTETKAVPPWCRPGFRDIYFGRILLARRSSLLP